MELQEKIDDMLRLYREAYLLSEEVASETEGEIGFALPEEVMLYSGFENIVDMYAVDGSIETEVREYPEEDKQYFIARIPTAAAPIIFIAEKGLSDETV